MDVIKEDTRQTIINVSIELFAKSGYANVSVRDIAAEVGIKPASLYYHFDNKQTLYLASIKESFSPKAIVLSEVLLKQEPAKDKLRHYINKLTQLAYEDEPFRCLMQREILDGDEKNMQYLAEKVFQNQFEALGELIMEINPKCDPYMTAISIIALILYHFEISSIRIFLKGHKTEYNQVDTISQHAFNLLMNGLPENQ